VRDARASLEIATAERASLKFTPADDAAVQAGKAKADAATATKKAECGEERGGRGSKCREKETAEGQALADLAEVTARKAMTDRAAKLDTNIATLREQIAHAGPVRETNAQGKALARLFGLDDAEAAALITRQNAAMMIVVELLIVVFILAAEEIGKHEPAPSPEQSNGRREADAGQEGEPPLSHPMSQGEPPLENQGRTAEIIQWRPRDKQGDEPPLSQGEPAGEPPLIHRVSHLLAQGVSQNKVAERLNVSRSTVQRIARKLAAGEK
jgi:hypothetical protein